MTDVPRDLILDNPFSLTEFKTTELGVAATRAIEQHADDIVRAAEAGEPPVALLIPDLDGLISEGLYWRMIERMIMERLGPRYEKSGRKPVNIGCHSRGRCYKLCSAADGAAAP